MCSSSKEKNLFFQSSLPAFNTFVCKRRPGSSSNRCAQCQRISACMAGSVCRALLTDCSVWFVVVILFGCLRDDLVPTSIHQCTITAGSNVCHAVGIESKNNPNGKADRGRNSCCSCKYNDLKQDVMYVAITSTSHPRITSWKNLP